jgi:hypothetical protein
MTLRGLLIAAPLLMLAAAACNDGGTAPLSDSGPVLGSIPWTTPERAAYTVKQGDTTGTGELSILAGADSLVFIQKFEVPENGVADEITVETNAQTLRPVKVERVTTDPDFERDCLATYGDASVTVVQTDEDDEHTDEVSVPNTHYDSWTDLFLWRTIDFAEGYESRYADVLSCNPRESEVITMVLEVKGVEQVAVPAGSFEVWHLKITSDGTTQDAWYSTDDSRVLVKYDNGPQTFELVSVD